MEARNVFQKTLPFAWAKLLLGLVTIGISVVIFAILMGISYLFSSGRVTAVMFIVWLGAVGVVRFVIMHYFGYLLKAGHVAVITEAVTTGHIPDNQVVYGKQLVTERFTTSNIYFAVDKLVSGAVRQIQRTVEKVGNALDFIPGMSTVTSLANLFVGISLGYIDECCLGYTFYMKEQGAFKSAADGVAIYAQNWKKLLKDAAKTMVIVVFVMIAIVLAAFLVFGLLFRLLNWSGFIAFVISCLLAGAIKYAFIDSYILVKMMTSYMEAAPTTQITFDLYSKLCGLSAKFRELFNKGREEQPTTAQTANVDSGAVQVQMDTSGVEAFGDTPAFCGKCGAKSNGGTKFCGSCGARMEL